LRYRHETANRAKVDLGSPASFIAGWEYKTT
jgi:hypothetical protein